MRITIVQGAFFPVPPILGGAIEKTWLGLGREFARRGHRVTHVSRRHPSLPNREALDGVEHVRVPGFSAVRHSLLLKLLDLRYTLRVRRILPEADLLVSNTFWLPILARDPRQGAVYVHVARMPKGQMRLYTRAARLQGVSSAVVAAMAAEAPQLAGKMSVVPLPLPWPVAAALPQPERTILYLGRVHPEKGLSLLLAAARELGEQLAGWRMRIVGPHEVKHGGGGEACLRSLREAAAGLPVEFAGPVFDAARLREAYAAARIFVYPSIAERGETFGLAPLEAMSCGCPAIVSDLACFRDFIQPGVNGVTFDHRALDAPQQLARQLQRLIHDEPLRRQLAGAALVTARDYQLPAVAQMYLADFATVLPNRRPLPSA
jgi:glycosyltransferase involved in cell wall biosynthesis